MRHALLSRLRCVECDGMLELTSGQNGDGTLTCTSCSRTYRLDQGVPRFVREISDAVQQVQDSYSNKWSRVPSMYDENKVHTEFMHDWYLRRYKWADEAALGDFLRGHASILDAGCGLGRDARWYAALQPEAEVVGADLSEAALIAGQKAAPYPNLSIIQADLNRLPFEPESFEFVACDQVLPCVEEPRASVERLWNLVQPGGHLAFYVYRKKSVVREFTDDYVRDQVTKLDPESAWTISERITQLGKALSDLKVEIDVPDIPELEIPGGRYDVQRFVFYNVLKCFWNDDMTWDENVVVNFDWFHPAYTYRHAIDEVRGWTDELGMDVLVLDEDEPSGISVLAHKPAR